MKHNTATKPARSPHSSLQGVAGYPHSPERPNALYGLLGGFCFAAAVWLFFTAGTDLSARSRKTLSSSRWRRQSADMREMLRRYCMYCSDSSQGTGICDLDAAVAMEILRRQADASGWQSRFVHSKRSHICNDDESMG